MGGMEAAALVMEGNGDSGGRLQGMGFRSRDGVTGGGRSLQEIKNCQCVCHPVFRAGAGGQGDADRGCGSRNALARFVG